MNICTVGTSWITESFIKASKLVDDVNIYGVYSRDEKRARDFMEKVGAKTFYFDFDKMLNDKNVDAVYIATPNARHFEQSKRALLNGKNVICEKPAVVTTEQLKELYDIADKNSLIFLEAIKSMHSDGLKIIKDAIKTIGEMRTVNIDFSQFSSKYYAYKNGENPNVFNPLLAGGGLMDIGVYAIYLSLEIFGEPLDILSHCDFLPNGCDFSGTLIFVYKEVTVTITYSKFANGFSGAKFLGSEGAVKVDSVSKLYDVKRIDNDGRETLISPKTDNFEVMSKEIKAFKEFTEGANPEYYQKCKKMSESVCSVMEKIRKDNGFKF